MGVAAASCVRGFVAAAVSISVCAGAWGLANGIPSSPKPRVISAADDRVVFEVDLTAWTLEPSVRLQGTETLEIRGFGRTAEPGEPAIPTRRFLVGLPPQGEPAVSWRVVRSEALGAHRLEPGPYPFVRSGDDGTPIVGEEYRIDEAVYRKGSSVIEVAPEPAARIRGQRVLPIAVTPVAYDPLTGETVLATLVRIEVSFGLGPGARSVDAPRAPAGESAAWEGIFGRILVNPEQSALWRGRPAVRPREQTRALAASQALSGPLVKLHVRETGLHRVKASNVLAKGFPAGVSLADLRVMKRGYDPVGFSEVVVDVPFRVVENPAGTSGQFDGADLLVFYGQRVRDDASREDPLEKFSASNVYWLGASGGTPMVSVPVAAGFASADTAGASFPASRRYEDDRVFFDPAPPAEKEFYYYHKATEASFSTVFDAPSVDPAHGFQLRARFLGGVRSAGNRIVKLSIVNSRGTTALDDAAVRSKDSVLYTSQVLPGSAIDDGENTLRIAPTADRTTLEALLDWFTIEYRAKYRARGNALAFNSASLAGDTSVTVTGLTRTDVMLFDVTDPLAPREYALTSAHFVNTGNGYAVSFRESFASRKDYVLAPADGIREIPPADVAADTPSALVGNPAEDGVDVLVVSHADFLGEMNRWAGLRRAQGYGVLMADVQDVFDEFNGGVPNPRGIKRFIRHFVENGGASFVVLVGDASEDNKRVSAVAAPNFVPTESYSEYAGGSFDQDEVVTTDNWYAMLDTDFIVDDPVLMSDFYPHVIIGRLPFGSAAEARDVVDKILRFETPRADDFWRRRMIRVADNAFSGGFGGLCYSPAEESFRLAEEQAAQTAENAIPGGFDVVRFYLADYLADVEPPHSGGNCINPVSLVQPTRARATPALLGELNAGATVVSFQAHMNRGLICHEYLFEASTIWSNRDHFQLTNTDRPWIAFGMGCHMSDYAIWDEHAPDKINNNFPNGDALSELMLLQKAGAVSTYGSSGFEYLTPNVRFTGVLADAFFDDVPTSPMAGSHKAQARWILGELMTAAEIENLSRNPRTGGGDGSVGQTKRFHLLGDPVLRVDGGPPRFEVTVNGQPFASGENVGLVAGGGVVDVRAVITDEAAVEKVSLEIAGQDSSAILAVTALKDEGLDAARQVEVRFRHAIEARNYDIVLRAYQAEDTTAGDYHVVAEFVFKVEASAELTVNGRPVVTGDIVPARGDYAFKVEMPVSVPRSLIRVEADGEPVAPLGFVPADSTSSPTWIVSFSEELSAGPHEMSLFVGASQFTYALIVGERAGVLDLIAYPNPFTDDVYFVFTNEIAMTNGSVDVFTVSGKKVAHIDIPPQARAPGQNAVRWDGRSFGGGEVANGTYLFVFSVDHGGQKTTERGKLVRMK